MKRASLAFGQIINTKLKYAVGKAIFFMNITIIAGGVFVLGDISMVIYSMVSVYAISKMMDASLEGVSFYKGIIIVSDKHKEIREQVQKSIKRDVYYVNNEKDNRKRLLFTALSRREVAFLKEYVKSIDENASVIIFNAQEYMGINIIDDDAEGAVEKQEAATGRHT